MKKIIESKAWKWEIVPQDDSHWNTPAPIIYYLQKRWLNLGFKTFLDIGCGFGRHSVFMAQAGFDVCGFDLSEHSVNVTIKNLKENKLEGKIEIADMLKFPYKSKSFNCMLALNVISHTDTNGFKKILSEIYRCLKPSGEVYFTLGSKDSFWFNNPVCIPVDENTKIRIEDGPENGIPHFYINDDDCFKLFSDFKLVDLQYVKDWSNKYKNWSPHYFIHLKKINPRLINL